MENTLSNEPGAEAQQGRTRLQPKQGGVHAQPRAGNAGRIPDDSMLVVDRAGKIAPLNERLERTWRGPQGGKTIPFNQRFTQMWQMPQKLVQRLIAESNLRRALERDELTVFYQPQANVATGEIDSVEALVRWRHPKRGFVLPSEFIPLAEETGVIIALGEKVLGAACSQSKAWRRQGLPPLRVAVNFSARQLGDPNLVEMISSVLEDTQLSPELLELEITESTTMGSTERTINALNQLREMGVRLSMDDFGSDYASLSNLKDLPIHTLKIDRSLIDGVTKRMNSAALTTAIIAMAYSLNLEIVAEGVETEAQLAFLADHRCHRYQGYLLSKPVPPEQIAAVLQGSQAEQAA